MSQDYLYRTIVRWEGKQPYDEYGHALDHQDIRSRGRGKRRQARDLTSPYGSLQFAVGSGDDFYCFDYGTLVDGRIALDAVVNSETGGFIQGVSYEIVKPEHAVDCAMGLVELALEWCNMGGEYIKHDTVGWNQDPYYFARDVANSLGTLGRKLVRRAVKYQVP